LSSQTDVRETDTKGKVEKKRAFDASDWAHIAETVKDDFETRKRNRLILEKHWKEIDRQVAMEPDLSHKQLANGQMDQARRWMSEMELPYQAQALEVLTADARRMLFPDSGPWFRAHAEMTDKYLKEVDFSAIILGDETEVPTQINQDNADKLTEGYLLHLFRQCDFFGRQDRINAETFKYGMGVGRARMETKNVYIHEARGVRKENQKIPVLVPVSIKNLYLDQPMPSMHSAQVLGESHIAHDYIRLENLQIAANKGSNDPDDPDGGWMPKNMKGIVADKDGYVEVLEMEGDIVVPRKTVRSLVIPGAIVTVVVGSAGSGEKATSSVIRFRFRKAAYSSYLLYPYHYEDTLAPYPTSPLMKGRPVQIMAVQALNRLLDSAALKNAPPIGYDRTDPEFARNGGPVIHPNAQWGSNDLNSIAVFEKIGGDPSALAAILQLAISMYAELTGVLPGRLGAQTVSHTTAFAKDAELSRGAVRTVDFVRQSGKGPIERWLDMAYRMGRDSIGARETISFFIDAYGGFVEVSKAHLPEKAIFEWFGSGGPAEEMQKKQAKLQSLTTALQMDQINVQMGGKPKVDVGQAIQATLREGGWSDLDTIIRADTATATDPENPALAMAALQQMTAGTPA
jgi:hypothetical protein